ncbi:hypothetical protein SBA5_520002 [Candidatus Sulfotelmatomonas gaucii]|uniref:Uncharacterized protein n=1 Tax=Candidatus Sulfuritelmatomonas gaucii TaxID=2043161 RepID=A0A2N9LS94_9BACT|nr:hypothetical protein SBA5_520002 [Candidatus Sulfotelmatomonas gaucii]
MLQRWIAPLRGASRADIVRVPVANGSVKCPRTTVRAGNVFRRKKAVPFLLLWGSPLMRSGWFPWETPAGNGLLGGRPQLTAGIRAGSYVLECSNLCNPASIESVTRDCSLEFPS